MLIQAFLVMDIAWAAGGEFCVIEDISKADTLAPELQIDAQALKVVFSNSRVVSTKTTQLTNAAGGEVSKIQKKPFLITVAVRNMVLTAALFVVSVLPFARPAFSNTAQARAPPALVQTLPADIQKLSGNTQALLEAIAKANKIKKPGKEQKQTITTGIRKKGLAFTNFFARKRVERVNVWIEQEWNKLSQRGQLDDYILRTTGTLEGNAIAKMKLLVQIANPDAYKILKSMNAAIFMGDIPGAAYTTGAQVSGTMGRPLIYINKKLVKNIFWGAFALNHEAIHAGDIPQSYFGLTLRYNAFTLIRAVFFSSSDPAEKKAYESEYKFTSKFGIVPEKGNRFVDEIDLAASYYEQRWNAIAHHLIGASVFNFLPFILGVGIIKYLIRRRDAGSQYPGLRNSSRNSFRDNRPLVKKNRRRSVANIFRSIILLPFQGIRRGAGSQYPGLRIKNDKRLIRKNRRRSNGNRFRSIILLPFLAFQFFTFFNTDFTQAANLKQTNLSPPTQVISLFNAIKTLNVQELRSQTIDWQQVNTIKRKFVLQSNQAERFETVNLTDLIDREFVEVPAGGFALSNEKDILAGGFFGCGGTVWYHEKTNTIVVGHHYEYAPDTEGEIRQIVEALQSRGIPLDEVEVTIVGGSDNSNGIFIQNLIKLAGEYASDLNVDKFDLFRAGEKAFYVEHKTGNIYRVNYDTKTSSDDIQVREEKHYASMARKVVYFTGLSAVVSVISTILTPAMAAAASTGIISTGTGGGLIVGAVLIGISFIGILGWMIRQRRKKEASFEVTEFSGQPVEENIKKLPLARERNSQQVPGKEEAEDTETRLKDKFADGQLDAVIFIDVDLMRLTNQYVAKKNVNALLDVLENELQSVINELGQENALSLRRGGDEFVLAVNSRGDKQTAIDIANRLKENVENTKFSVASIGPDKPLDDVIETIETLGGRIDVIGRQYIVIIPQKAGGLRGKARAEEFIDEVNTITQLQAATPQEAKGILSIKRSWLDRKAVSNEVSFTLSIGVAHATEAKDVVGDNLYEQTHNLAAHRKDSSKETFKKIGNGHIESEASFRKRVSGESILTSEEARKDLEEFNKLQHNANRLEKDGINTGLSVESASDVLYFSTQDAARTYLNNRMGKGELADAIAFSLQGLGYYDENGKIDEYKRAYYNAPGAVKDNRIDILDFKVVNEAHGYVAGDEVIARMRMAAIKSAKLFEGFEVIFVRGPPAGPIGFLLPKTKQASNMAAVSVQAMFDKYMDEVGNYFNRKQDTIVKIGHFRVVWDNISPADKHIGEVLERISKARAVYEYTHKSEHGINHAYKYTESISESWQVMEEKYAAEAVEQLENLKRQWQINASDSTLRNDLIEDARLEERGFERILNDLVNAEAISQSI